MSSSRKLLIIGGLLVAICGMIYGLWYAVFDEHQTLQQMGISLATGFAEAAGRNMPASYEALETYRAVSGEYVREVHAHSHWITLGMILIVLGMFYERVSFAEPIRLVLAIALLAGTAIFPLGVLLQALVPGMIGKILSITGSLAVIGSFGGITLGLMLPERR